MNQSQQDSSTSTGNNHLESFIPVTRFALIDTLVNEAANNGDRKDVVCFFQLLGQWRHQEHQDRLLRLKERYLPFSPDRDTIRVLDYSSQQLEVMKDELIDDITAMLERANYNLIDADGLNRLLSTHSAYGLELKVDQLEYDEILVYYRGAGEETLVQRNWQKLFKKEAHTIPTFKRLFLLLKLKPEARRVEEIMDEKDVSEKKAKRILEKRRDKLPKSNGDSFIYLKLFKNIPQEDLEMMFPNTQVQFKLFDKIKLGMTAGGGTVAGVAGAASKAMAAVAAANPIALAGSIFGIVGIITRQVMNFFNTRNRYMLALSRRLYFHSLADNRGALTLLWDRGEEEDIKEAMLLYHFLLRKPVLRNELHLIDAEIEHFLMERYGVKVNFDIADAIDHLLRDGIVQENEQGQLIALSAPECKKVLEQRWRERLSNITTAEVDLED